MPDAPPIQRLPPLEKVPLFPGGGYNPRRVARHRQLTIDQMLDPPVLRRGPIAAVAPLQPIDRTYSYLVPDPLADRVVPGVRVSVRLGPAARTTEAYCIEVSEGDWDSALRPVEGVIDDRPLMSPAMLELARWISRYYAAPLGWTISSVIPSSLRRGAGMRDVRCVTIGTAATHMRTPSEKTASTDVAGDTDDAKPKVSQRRQAVLDVLAAASGPLSIDDLRKAVGCGPGLLRAMEAAGLIAFTTRRELPIGDAAESQIVEPTFDLNPEQYAVAERIIAAMEPSVFRVLVLFGVTGSGKTEVYVRAMRHAVAAGKQAILLVPEIALTTQTVQRLSKRFSRVAVVHSGLSDVQRARAWSRIAAGQVDIVIGTRSAVFAPCPRLGVIIVDEEQESSFKNLASPRYHTRDVAVKRGQIESIPVILGSATPSLETWHNAHRLPHYELLRLPRRVAGLPAPTLHLVDMREEHKARRGIHLLSRMMEEYLRTTLDKKEQAVLLLNRRGFANYLFCPRCNTPIMCPNCGVYVVFHLATDMAHCHYCHERVAVPQFCPMAGCDGTLVRFGMGTERVEQELAAKFPKARLARMDSDIMVRPSDYAKVLKKFDDRQIDILVGTQMIAKGLDYSFVSFVGVVSADTALSIGDFRSTERTFQLVLQVAGRSGRSDVGGDVVVQTFNADLPTIKHALRQDYENFAAEELDLRRRTRLPPITRMVRLVLSDSRLTRVRKEAERLAVLVREKLFAAGVPAQVFDARPCSLPRLRNRYRFEVVMVFESGPQMLTGIDALRRDELLSAHVQVFTVDVDPVSLQ